MAECRRCCFGDLCCHYRMFHRSPSVAKLQKNSFLIGHSTSGNQVGGLSTDARLESTPSSNGYGESGHWEEKIALG